MESLYQAYKDIAIIRLVYINEAHAADSSWSVGYAKDLDITEHDDYGERCEAATKLFEDKALTIPFVIDGMENLVNKAYSAWPDRVFMVRTDGRLAVAGDRGPWGFKPALDSAEEWLVEFRRTGKDPALPDDAAEPGKDRHVTAKAKDDEAEAPADESKPTTRAAEIIPAEYGRLLGSWNMETEFQGQVIEAVMTLVYENGLLIGTWESMGREMELEDLLFNGTTLTFERSIGGEQTLKFKGTLEGDKIDGMYSSGFGELESNGVRADDD